MGHRIGTLVLSVVVLTGCARLDFESPDDGLAYYDAVPYFFVTTTAECVSTGTVVMVPGDRKIVKLKSGFGASELSVTLSNGMISAVGQKTDTKVPETITSIATLGTAVAAFKDGGGTKCVPTANLYPVVNGRIDTTNGPAFQEVPVLE